MKYLSENFHRIIFHFISFIAIDGQWTYMYFYNYLLSKWQTEASFEQNIKCLWEIQLPLAHILVIIGEVMTSTTVTRNGVHLDTAANGFCGGSFEKTYFYVRVFNPLAPFNRKTQMPACYHKHENVKRGRTCMSKVSEKWSIMRVAGEVRSNPLKLVDRITWPTRDSP